MLAIKCLSSRADNDNELFDLRYLLSFLGCGKYSSKILSHFSIPSENKGVISSTRILVLDDFRLNPSYERLEYPPPLIDLRIDFIINAITYTSPSSLVA